MRHRSPSARNSAATPARSGCASRLCRRASPAWPRVPCAAPRVVQAAAPRVAEVPLGGTAVGPGINTPIGFPQKVIELLATDTGLPITEALDHFEAQGARDGLVEASGALRVIAVSLTKICNDLRWMGSGPNTGLGELHIPDLQPGASIMPGDVNPAIPEA